MYLFLFLLVFFPLNITHCSTKTDPEDEEIPATQPSLQDEPEEPMDMQVDSLPSPTRILAGNGAHSESKDPGAW